MSFKCAVIKEHRDGMVRDAYQRKSALVEKFGEEDAVWCYVSIIIWWWEIANSVKTLKLLHTCW